MAAVYGRRIIILVVMLAPILVVGAYLFGTSYAPIDKVSLVYEGGPFDGNNYKFTALPGQGRFFTGGVVEQVYRYPITNRSYIISSRSDEGDVQGIDRITFRASNGVPLYLECAVYFKLDYTDKNALKRFHETHGMKYEAWTEDGWKALLEEMIRQPIQSAAQEEGAKFQPIEAMSKDGKARIGDEIAQTLQKRVDKVMDGHYFKIISFGLKDIRPEDKEIVDAMADVIVSEQQVKRAENEKIAAKSIAEKNRAIRESLQGSGGMEAVLSTAIEKGKVDFMVVPYGQPLVMPTSGR